ncbi:MAG: glycosyltransferase family 39 protein [Ignavibacteriales bacterium]|nr:glycosyltransferase family 39 protein [Ignavibacteriales bacterium]
MGLRDVILLSLCIIIFSVGAFQNPQSPKSSFRNLDPLPDAAEYAILASNIYQGVGARLSVNETTFPSRYPLGFSILIIPFYAVLGNDIANAFYCLFLLGLLSIVVLYLLARNISNNPFSPFLATFFFAANPLVWILSGLVMSEMATTFFLLLSLYSLSRIRLSDTVGWFILLGCSIGYAAFIRIPNIAIAAPIIVYLVWRKKVPFWSARMMGFMLPLLFFCGVIAMQNYFLYGSVFGTGYSAHSVVSFGFGYFLTHSLHYFKSLFLGIGGVSLWTTGPFYSEIITVFLVVGIYSLVREKKFGTLIVGVGISALLFVIYSAWFFLDVRFLLPLFPLIFIGAAYGISYFVSHLKEAHRWSAIAIVAAIYFVNPIHPSVGSLAAAERKFSKSNLPTNYIQVQEVNAYMDSINAERNTHILITSLNLVYQEHLSNKRYSVLPFNEKQEYTRFLKISSLIDTCKYLLKNNKNLFISDYDGSNGGFFTESAYNEFKQNFTFEAVREYLYGNARLYRLTPKHDAGN